MKQAEAVAKTPIVLGHARVRGASTMSADAFAVHVSWLCMAAGVIFLAGAMFDVVLLWGFQRIPTPEFEFTALLTTIEGLPRIGLGAAFVAAALWLRGSTSLIAYRILGFLVVLTGIAGVVVAGLVVTDWFVLRGEIPPEAIAQTRSLVIKAVALGAMYTFVFIPAGVLSMRRPRS